jgi:mono/diheme cytochrome c family protein
MRNFMALRRPQTAILPMLVGLAISFATFANAQGTAATEAGDPERGKVIYQRVGYCANCHGWAGDGKAGVNPMAHGVGANLRETVLDAEGLTEVIKCGRPGTQMPYHDTAAYRDDRCYGQVMADFQQGEVPVRGKTFRDKDVSHLVAYLQQYMVGLGKPTLEECALYYGASADKACDYLRSE